MRSLSTELIRHKRITTTEAKAKEAGRFVEGLITKAKRAHLAEKEGGELNLAARRHLGKVIQDRAILRELFNEVAEKVANRPGGYTRVIRIGRRNGDGAEMAVLELVDYNLERDDSAARSRSKKTMSRAERVKRSQQKQAAAAEADEAATEEAPAEEVAVEDAPVEDAPAEETVAEETTEQVDSEDVQEKLEEVPAPESGGGGTVPEDATNDAPEDAPVDAAPGYDNQTEEIASVEDPAEPLTEEQTAQEIKKPAPEDDGADDEAKG